MVISAETRFAAAGIELPPVRSASYAAALNAVPRQRRSSVIAQIRSLTSKPFAMKLWVSMEDEGARTSDESAFNRSLAPLAVHLAALGAPRPVYKPYSPARFEDQARVLVDESVPVFSFIYGVPPREILAECRTKGIVTIGTATTPDEAAALQDAAVNAIVASGFEAGGLRGSFLGSAEDSLTGTLSLVPQIVDKKAAGHTALTRGFTGRLARGIHNRLMDELNRNGTGILPYPLQRGVVRNLSIPAEAAGRSDLLPLWAGQSANLSTCADVSAFCKELVEGVSQIAGPVIQWSANRSRKHSNS